MKTNIKPESYLPLIIETTIMTMNEPFDIVRILQEINAYEIEETPEEQENVLGEVLDSYINDGLILHDNKTGKFELCKY